MISVIVPVFNVENYIEKCVKNLLNQTFNDIEILLINDGSTDKSGLICEGLRSLDSRISVYHKSNGGAAQARNFGVSKAKGEYIGFIDADDVVHKDYFSILYDNLIKTESEISCCRYVSFVSGTPEFCFDRKKDTFDRVSACQSLMTTCNFLVPPWGKIIKTEIVRKHPFPEGRVDEDEAVIYLYLYSSKKVVISDSILYGYLKNANGVMSKNKEKHALDLWQSLNERASFFKEKKEIDLYNQSLCQLMRATFCLISMDLCPISFNVRELVKKEICNKKEKMVFRFFCFLYLIFGKWILKIKY